MSQIQKNLKERERLRMKELAVALEEEESKSDDDVGDDNDDLNIIANAYDCLFEDDDEKANASSDDDDDNNNDDDDNDEKLNTINTTTEKVKKKNTRRKKNKKKKKQNKSKQNHSSVKTSSISNDKNIATSSSSSSSLFMIKPSFLDCDNEIKRKFGSSVLKFAREDDEQQHPQQGRHRSNTRRRKRTTILGRQYKNNTFIGHMYTSMTMVQITPFHFEFQYADASNNIEYEYQRVIASHQPQAIANFLQLNPNHCLALLQMSRIYMHYSDITAGATCLERCLYSYESMFHRSFTNALCKGNAQLAYNIEANQGFYIALFRYAHYLGKKGCCRTALEYCKLLLSLDYSDPTCILVHLGYYALCCGEYEYLIRFCKNFNAKSTWNHKIYMRPSYAYALALSKYYLESQEERKAINMDVIDEHMDISTSSSSSQLIQRALLQFPDAIVPLMKKLNQKSAIQEPWYQTPHFRKGRDRYGSRDFIKKMVTIFVERHHTLWKDKNIINWLNANANNLVVIIENNEDICKKYDVDFNHIYNNYENIPEKLKQIQPWDYADATLPPLQLDDVEQNRRRVFQGADPFVRIQPNDDNNNALMVFLRTLLPWVHLEEADVEFQG